MLLTCKRKSSLNLLPEARWFLRSWRNAVSFDNLVVMYVAITFRIRVFQTSLKHEKKLPLVATHEPTNRKRLYHLSESFIWVTCKEVCQIRVPSNLENLWNLGFSGRKSDFSKNHNAFIGISEIGHNMYGFFMVIP